jgi:hypothetical protein
MSHSSIIDNIKIFILPTASRGTIPNDGKIVTQTIVYPEVSHD